MASHAVLKEQLIEMGFDEKLIKGALHLLSDKATLESVIEAIENGTAEVEAAKMESDPKSAETADNPNAIPTPEEVELKKKQMEDRIKQRRKEIEEIEKEAERQREIQRRRDGKDMGKMREEIEKIQREKLAESIRREKESDKAARDAILRKIEQDKAERRARNAGGAPPAPAVPAAPVVQSIPPPVSNANGKTKLAIRLLDGTSIIQEFEAKEVLSAVRAYVVTQKNIACNITLAMPPRPPFSEEDFTKSLQVLGLVPNARLQVVKRNN